MSGIMKLDCSSGFEDRWFGEIYEVMQEPVLAMKTDSLPDDPERDEDDIYVLVLLHNAKDYITELLVFDGRSICNGPVSRTKLPVYIPYGLHGTFAPGLVFNKDDVERRWLACNALESKSWNKMDGGFSGLGISYK